MDRGIYERRQVLMAAASGVAAFAIPSLLRAGDRPTLGLIVPPALPWSPDEGLELYRDRVNFLAEGLGLQRLTPEGYDSVVDKIAPLARRLAERGAQGLVLMGTSLSFYKGSAFNQRLIDSMQEASGLPATTMSAAVIDGLKMLGGRRIAVATAYNDVVNERLRVFLEENGMDTAIIEGLDIEDIRKVEGVTKDDLITFGARVAKKAKVADAILLSCGGLKTLDVLRPLEAASGLPVVSSSPHAYWAGLRLVGADSQREGYGALLAQG